MRDIKFRQWDEQNKRFSYWGFTEPGTFQSPMTQNNNAMDTPHQQLTGLLDKDGIEIYESDLLEIEKVVGEVYWREESGQWWLKGEWGSNALHNFLSYGEVIGNKYEKS